MSYLELTGGIAGFKQAVISLWFRVPQASVDAARASDTFNFPRTIPLVTFAEFPTVEDLEPNSANIATATNFPPPPAVCPPVISVTAYNSVGSVTADPCYIGLNCSSGHPTLVFNFQTAGHAVITGYVLSVTAMAVYHLQGTPPPFGPNEDPTAIPGSGWNDLGFPFVGLASGVVDFSYVQHAKPEYFYVATSRPVEPDTWHHLLLSPDLTADCNTHGPDGDTGRWDNTSQGTTSFCKLWYAIDDVNYDGEDNLKPFFVDGGTDPNAILTDNAWHVANASTGHTYNLADPSAVCHYVSTAIPTDNEKAVGIPAQARFVDSIYPVELAELQFFTEATLDTKDEDSRRVFIDADGEPVDPTPTPDDPTDPNSPMHSPAERLLGKKADILLHGSGDWIKGRNTGPPLIDNPDYDSSKPESPDNPKLIRDPAKQFTPTGKIVSYTPDPSLGATAPPVRLTRAPADG